MKCLNFKRISRSLKEICWNFFVAIAAKRKLQRRLERRIQNVCLSLLQRVGLALQFVSMVAGPLDQVPVCQGQTLRFIHQQLAGTIDRRVILCHVLHTHTKRQRAPASVNRITLG